MRFIISTDPDFTDAALDELGDRDPSVRVISDLAPGVTLIETGGAERALGTALSNAPAIFVRHLMPVHATVPLNNTEADVAAVADAVRNMRQFGRLGPDAPFSVQARVVTSGERLPERPYSTSTLRDAIAPMVSSLSGATEDVRAPEMVVSVLLDDRLAYAGISSVAENLSDWAGGQHRLARDAKMISRAEFKLLEALAVFNLRLPSEGRALDLGAAPGGWTRLLLEAGLQVMAVDPAELDPRLKSYGKQVRHIPGRAQGFLDRARRERSRYLVVLSDMRLDAPETARLMVQAADILNPNGFALVTLKLPHRAPGVDPLALMEEALEIMGERYREVQARQLFHNRHEVTVLLVP